MESVIEGFIHPETRLPLMVAPSVEMDMSLGSIQIGSLGCEGCSVLLYSLQDQIIVTFKYVDGELMSEQTYDTSLIGDYHFTLETRHDLNDKSYYSICLNTVSHRAISLINIQDFECAKSAMEEMGKLKERYPAVH
jgi:hypothetical protein